jgi:hypothetical protein
MMKNWVVSVFEPTLPTREYYGNGIFGKFQKVFMKEKIEKYFLTFWVVCVGVLLLITLLSSRSDSAYEVTSIIMKEPYPCIKTGLGYIKVEYFNSNDEMFICGNITSNSTEFRERIAQYIFIIANDEVKPTKYPSGNADYSSLTWFSSDDYAIHIIHYLPPGKYVIKLVHGRNVICLLDFKVQ